MCVRLPEAWWSARCGAPESVRSLVGDCLDAVPDVANLGLGTWTLEAYDACALAGATYSSLSAPRAGACQCRRADTMIVEELGIRQGDRLTESGHDGAIRTAVHPFGRVGSLPTGRVA